MREHLDRGRLQAYLDGELDAVARQAATRHLETCERCRESLEAVEACSRVVREILEAVDPLPPDPRVILWQVRRRQAVSRARARRRRTAVAASLILLVGAGLAAAAPGSPIRDWWESRWNEPMVAPDVTPADVGTFDETQISVLPLDGAVLVSLESAGPGSPLEVEVADVDRVTVTAPSGARFETGAGHVQIDAADSVGGEIRIELPGRARSEVRVAGQLYVVVEDGQVERPGPEPSRSADGILRFEFAPGSGSSDDGTSAVPGG